MSRAPTTGPTTVTPWRFACPVCRRALPIAETDVRCAACGLDFPSSDGIWRFLPPHRLARYERFMREYGIVRTAEGWGRAEAAYFRTLPDVPVGDPQWAIWRRRRRTYETLLRTVIEPAEECHGRPLHVLDLGAGNCWLSHRLSRHRHRVAAVDISAHPTDGLGAHLWYGSRMGGAGARFTPIQAEFDRLPFLDGAADVVIFNASLHYSTDLVMTLTEALRVLSPAGTIAVVDSPLYRDPGSGEAMLRERRAAYERRFGFPSDALPGEGFLTTSRLAELSRTLHVRWVTHDRVGWRSRIATPWRRLRGRREPARLPVIVGARE